MKGVYVIFLAISIIYSFSFAMEKEVLQNSDQTVISATDLKSASFQQPTKTENQKQIFNLEELLLTLNKYKKNEDPMIENQLKAIHGENKGPYPLRQEDIALIKEMVGESNAMSFIVKPGPQIIFLDENSHYETQMQQEKEIMTIPANPEIQQGLNSTNIEQQKSDQLKPKQPDLSNVSTTDDSSKKIAKTISLM